MYTYILCSIVQDGIGKGERNQYVIPFSLSLFLSSLSRQHHAVVLSSPKRKSVVELLIKKGADVNSQNKL